jgi:hypothetical protein
MTGDLTITFTAACTPEEAFAAVTDVRGWCPGRLGGRTDALGAEFTYRYQDLHRSTQRITELDPGRRVAWHVVEGYLAFVQDTTEWTGSDITFDLTPADDGTRVRFTHVGLASGDECFETCSSAWHFYVGTSLPALIAERREQPTAVGGHEGSAP